MNRKLAWHSWTWQGQARPVKVSHDRTLRHLLHQHLSSSVTNWPVRISHHLHQSAHFLHFPMFRYWAMHARKHLPTPARTHTHTHAALPPPPTSVHARKVFWAGPFGVQDGRKRTGRKNELLWGADVGPARARGVLSLCEGTRQVQERAQMWYFAFFLSLTHTHINTAVRQNLLFYPLFAWSSSFLRGKRRWVSLLGIVCCPQSDCRGFFVAKNANGSAKSPFSCHICVGVSRLLKEAGGRETFSPYLRTIPALPTNTRRLLCVLSMLLLLLLLDEHCQLALVGSVGDCAFRANLRWDNARNAKSATRACM